MDDAFVNAVTSTGASALHLAASRGVPEVVEALLADGRCDVALKDFKGKTALDRSSRSHSGISKMLEDAGAGFAGSAFPTAPDFSKHPTHHGRAMVNIQHKRWRPRLLSADA